MKYRDYFSLKTLHRFGVEPDRTLNTAGNASEVKGNILATFGTLDEKDMAFLSHKTDCALFDMHIAEPASERESIEIPEALEHFDPIASEIGEISAPTSQRTL